MKIFVFLTEFCRCNKSQTSNQTEFVRLVATTKFCCSEKDFHKNPPVRTKRFVAATCRRGMLLHLVAQYSTRTRRDLSLRCVATKSCCNWSPDLYTWSDLWLRRVAATCRLVCTDLKLRRPEPIYIFVRRLRSVHTRRQVAATCRGDILQLQIASCVLENFCENLYRCNRICRRNKSHRFSLI